MQHIFRFVKIGVFVALLASIICVVGSVTGSMAGTHADSIDLQHTIGKLARTANGALIMVKKALDEAEKENAAAGNSNNSASNNSASNNPASPSSAPTCPAGYTCQPIIPDTTNHSSHTNPK